VPAPVGPGDKLLEWIESSGEGGPMSLAGTVTHLRTFWERRGADNVALFHYGDMLADLPGQMNRLAGVLDIDRSEDRISELAAEATFDSMKSRSAQVAPNADVAIWRNTEEFFHRGSSGQWREVFDDASLRRYEERVAELAPPPLATWMHDGWLGAGAVPDQRQGSCALDVGDDLADPR
jgi:hypothetical protein